MNGLDIANYQAQLNATKIAGQFVIVKATEGSYYTNPSYTKQVRETLAGGKKLGLYHFAGGGNWKREADYFLRTVKPYLNKAILVLDYEGPAVTAGGVLWAKYWLDYVYSKTGTKPLIYLGLADENRFNWSPVAKKYGLWVAQYNNMNPHYGYKLRSLYGHLRNWSKYTILQYTSTGRLAGWVGNLDLDYYAGTENDWLKHTKNKTEGDEEMTWSIEVPATSVGGFLVTKKAGATLWSDANNDKKVGAIKYNTNWVVNGIKAGFVNLGKGQYADSRTGILKLNPVHDNPNMHCKIVVRGAAKYHVKPHDEGYGKEIKKGTVLHAYKFTDNYFAIKTKTGKTVYVNGNKVKIVLG